jgi:NAD(P)-dependent dehydrogenase (short-subunit alcohol dehydrogenase family)
VGNRKQSLVKDGGSVILMSSVSAVRGTAGMSIYSASKGAIESLAQSAAIELAPRRIRVNAIRAGAFESPMHERIVARLTPEQYDAYCAKHPLGIGRAIDVAQMAVYLMSDAGRWITGSSMCVDGGYSCK